MRIYQTFRDVLRDNWRAYLWLNVLVYGTLIAMMIVTVLVPGLQERGGDSLTDFTSLPVLSIVADAYSNGQVVTAMLATFLANLLFAALLTTTLPSLVIPFFGVAATVGRAVLIGMWLAPTSPEAAIAMLPHAPVLVIEFQAYVLAALGSLILWRTTFGDKRGGFSSAWSGYRAGIADNLRLYAGIVVVLFVIAAVEAVEVILLLPLLH